MSNYVLAQATIKYQTEWLKQQTFLFLQFWKLEVQEQGPSRLGTGETSLFLANLQLPSHCVFMQSTHFA